MHRTKAGLILEKILHENKHRYLFCWNGEDEGSSEYPYDCGCCITWFEENSLRQCGCICHERIEQMASQRHIKLWLLAAEAMNELPPFFTSYVEKLTYCKKAAAEHAALRADWTPKQKEILGSCQCEFCEFFRNDVNRKFFIEGEDNSHVPVENISAVSAA